MIFMIQASSSFLFVSASCCCCVHTYTLQYYIKFSFINSCIVWVSACPSINHRCCRWTIVRRAVSTSDIVGHQQIGSPAWPNQAGISDRTSGSGVFAWHAQHQSLVATLASIRSSLDHPVETVYTDVRPANCIAFSVTATIVTSFKVAFAFLRRDLRTTPITSRQRLHDNLITAKTTVRLSAAPR